MSITEKRTKLILDYLTEKHYLESCGQYGEDGYNDPETGILFCDWNDIAQITQDYLEEAGFDLEWSDQWYVDYDKDKAWRTNPDCYSWQCQLHYTEGEIITPDDEPIVWFEALKVTDPAQPISAAPSSIDLESLDELTEVNEEYEKGFESMDDDPQKIAAHFLGLEGVESVVFQLTESSQFYIKFRVFIEGDLCAFSKG